MSDPYAYGYTAPTNSSDNQSDIAKSIHSLTITVKDHNGKESVYNTWDTWHLVPTSRPTFKLPDVKTYGTDIPGSNGKFDFTESLTGYPSYNNRTGSIEFLVMHRGLDTSLGEPYGYDNESLSAWEGIYKDIANKIHGVYAIIESSDIQDWYFKGRLSIDEWKSDSAYSSITLNYDLEPFKYRIMSSADLWKWDPFNFTSDVIRTYNARSDNKDKIVYDTDGKTFTIVGTIRPIVPTIFVDTYTTLKTPSGKFDLSPGNISNPLIIVNPGEQQWTFTAKKGTGNGAIYFRERSL